MQHSILVDGVRVYHHYPGPYLTKASHSLSIVGVRNPRWSAEAGSCALSSRPVVRCGPCTHGWMRGSIGGVVCARAFDILPKQSHEWQRRGETGILVKQQYQRPSKLGANARRRVHLGHNGETYKDHISLEVTLPPREF